MVNPRQRRKLKNPVQKRKAKKTNRKTAVPGIALVQQHWDKSKSIQENYSNLGLMQRLNKPKGGISSQITEDSTKPFDLSNCESMDNATLSRYIGPEFGVIERDEEGNIVNITIADKEDYIDKPLPKAPAKTEFMKELESLASQEVTAAKFIGELDRKMCVQLINKYGDDFKAMSRDHKINMNQLTPKQIKRLIEKYHSIVGEGKE
ncbi:hypothetical protein K502DRAFT_340963 [Neoconidiobolus thromboides FSU 785]|nr:hypothetical protein K502DRAFT_340963 [Neoconidiobolus thromboides FSU 785]